MGNYSQCTIHKNVQENWQKQSLNNESSLEKEEMELEELSKLIVQARNLEKRQPLKKSNLIYNIIDEV